MKQTLKSIPCSTFSLRPFRQGDAASLARYANNRKIWANVRDHFPHPYTEAHAERYLRQLAGHPEETVFAIDQNGQVIGSAGLKNMGDPVYRLSREIGFWLGEPFWGKGIMTETIGRIVEFGFRELGLIRIQAEVFDHNPASMHILSKNGFQKEGILRQAVIKDGKIEDLHIFGRLKPREGKNLSDQT